MSLTVAARHRMGTFELDIDFASQGRLTALFGASGAGKSTIISLIAGLIRPQRARIVVDDRILVDTDKGVFVPKHRRRIGCVFQDARLFPHLTVEQNLHYGRYFALAKERHADPGAVVDLLGIGHLMMRRPGTLSGGERQRVAIGRALLSSPQLILMDEPLASLDDGRKAEILPYIERLRDESSVPIVYVSHAISEVARLATDVVFMAGGRSIASGPASDVLSRSDLSDDGERADAGVLLDMSVVGHEAQITVLHSGSGSWRVPRLDAAIGAALRVRVQARDVMLATMRLDGISALNIVAGTITAIRPQAHYDVMIELACGEDRILAKITSHSVAALGLGVGKSVFAIVKAVSFAGRNQPHGRPKDA